MSDLISRQAAIDALDRIFDRCEEIEAHLPEGDPDKSGYKMYPDYITVWKYLHQLPSAQPKPCEDTVSREAVSEWLKQYGQDVLHGKYKFSLMYIWKNLMDLPSAQPERTCVNCGRTANNGGWYADGGTRCPIEEHYALPKDGYCHLWEKRNVTDDDYPERRTDECTD